MQNDAAIDIMYFSPFLQNSSRSLKNIHIWREKVDSEKIPNHCFLVIVYSISVFYQKKFKFSKWFLNIVSSGKIVLYCVLYSEIGVFSLPGISFSAKLFNKKLKMNN